VVDFVSRHAIFWVLVLAVAAVCVILIIGTNERGNQRETGSRVSVQRQPDTSSSIDAKPPGPKETSTFGKLSPAIEPQPPAAPRTTIFGKILSAIGSTPIEKAKVEFRFWDRALGETGDIAASALTGPHGSYKITLQSAPDGRIDFSKDMFLQDYRDLSSYKTQSTVEVNIYLIPADGMHGRVVDENGNPVAGAALYSEYEGQTMGRCHRLDSLSCTTGADGKFEVWGELRSIGDRREYKVITIVHPAFCDKELKLTRLSEKGGVIELGDVVLSRGLSISGTVRDSEGHHLAGATVVIGGGEFPPVMAGDEFQKNVRTDRSGAFTITGLMPGRYELRAFSENLPPGESGTIHLTGNLSGIDITLPGGGEISGTVKYSDGTPIPDCVVYADQPGECTIKRADGTTVRSIRSCDRGKHGPLSLDEGDEVAGYVDELYRETRSDSAGTYRLTGIPLDTDYTVVAVLPVPGAIERYQRYSEETHVQKQVARAGATANFTFKRFGRISGTVVDEETGLPITGDFTVSVWTPWGMHAQVTVDKERGTFLAERVVPGTPRIEAKKFGYVPQGYKEIELDAAQSIEGVKIVIRKQEGFVGDGKVSGQVVDAATSAPIADATISLWTLSGEFCATAMTDGTGSFTISARESGYRFFVSHKDYIGEQVEREKDADEFHEIALTRGAVIKGRVIASDPRIIVKSSIGISTREGCPWGDRISSANIEDSSGEFEFNSLKAGTYYLRWSESKVQEIVGVSPGETKVIELVIPDADK
jgi:hypothetical protein